MKQDIPFKERTPQQKLWWLRDFFRKHPDVTYGYIVELGSMNNRELIEALGLPKGIHMRRFYDKPITWDWRIENWVRKKRNEI